jgi:hypothetical protein
VYVWTCFLCGKTVYNLLGTSQYVVAEGLDGKPENGRPPTKEELKEISYHEWYVSQLYGGRYGS